MIAEKLTLLLAVAGQASAAFTVGHLAADSYIETDTSNREHDNSASKGKLVVATRTLGDLTYTYLSSDFTPESATDALGAMPEATSSSASPFTSIVTKTATATATAHKTSMITITRTGMANSTQPATRSRPALDTGDLPFHVHGGGDYTSVTFYGYDTPTLSTTHATSMPLAPYAHSIETTPVSSTVAPTAASITTLTTSMASMASTTSEASLTTVPGTSSTAEISASTTTPLMTSSPVDSLPSTSVSSMAETKSATTLSGLTVPAESATATGSPKAAETHGLSAGSHGEAALSTVLLSMALVYVFVL